MKVIIGEKLCKFRYHVPFACSVLFHSFHNNSNSHFSRLSSCVNIFYSITSQYHHLEHNECLSVRGWMWSSSSPSLYYLNNNKIWSLKDHNRIRLSDLEMTEETTELPVSDLSEWSNQMMMAVMLSQQFFPYLHRATY